MTVRTAHVLVGIVMLVYTPSRIGCIDSMMHCVETGKAGLLVYCLYGDIHVNSF